jgi:hypothetical protein
MPSPRERKINMTNIILLKGASWKSYCVDPLWLSPLIIHHLVCKHNATYSIIQYTHQDDNDQSVTTTLVPVKEELKMSLLLKVLLFPSSLIVSFVFVVG